MSDSNENKPKKILLTYIAKVSVEVSDIEYACGISWGDVSDIEFNTTNIHLIMKDGSRKCYDMETEFSEDTESYLFREPNSMNIVTED